MIRAYHKKDLSAVIEVWSSATKVAHPFLDSAFIERERENIATRHLPHAETWVFERDGLVVGFIALIGNEIGALFVDAQFHRQGIGRALMDHARNVRAVLELEVFKDNRVGRAFYEKYGFSSVDKRVHKETGFILLRLRLGHKMPVSPLDAARQYLELFYSGGNLADLRGLLADDLQFEGPFHTSNSADAYIHALQQGPPAGMRYQIMAEFQNESQACVLYQFHKEGISTPMAQLFEVGNGKIRRIMLVFDGRAFT